MKELWRDPVNLFLIIGEFAIWAIQDTLMAVDDNIVELPDY